MMMRVRRQVMIRIEKKEKSMPSGSMAWLKGMGMELSECFIEVKGDLTGRYQCLEDHMCDRELVMPSI